MCLSPRLTRWVFTPIINYIHCTVLQLPSVIDAVKIAMKTVLIVFLAAKSISADVRQVITGNNKLTADIYEVRLSVRGFRVCF